MKAKEIGLALSVVLAWAALTPASLSAAPTKLKVIVKASTAAPASLEDEFIQRINAERSKRGLNTLTIDPLLTETARHHSQDMANRDYFSHHSPAPEPKTPLLRYVKSLEDSGGEQPDWMLVGENIYYCSVFTKDFNVKYSHQALMDSPAHRANILEPRYQKIGVGVYVDPIGEFYVTEMFLRDTPETTAHS